MAPVYMADFSLALINRSGAYHVCRELLAAEASYFENVRMWRMFRRAEPPGVIGKAIGKAMLAELEQLRDGPEMPWPDRRSSPSVPRVFMDPLYVIRSRLDAQDIVLCHDIGPFSHPELFDPLTCDLYRRAYAKIAAVKPGMVHISRHTQKEFHAYFGDEFRFSEVVLLYPRVGAVEGAMRAPEGVRKPFILTVGALERRKNHARIIAAFERSGLRERGYQYVFCGPRGLDHARVVDQADGTPGVLCLSFASPEELRWLYANASAFVLPSLLEGLSNPPVEAAAHGLPSIVSRNSAQVEGVGDGCLTVDPYDVEDIAAALVRLALMPKEDRAALADKALRHAKSLSFERFRAGWRTVLEHNGPAPQSAGSSDAASVGQSLA